MQTSEATMHPLPSEETGFTLLELMLVLTILGFMTALGVGMLSLERPPLQEHAQRLVTAASAARSQAILSNSPVVLTLQGTRLSVRRADNSLVLQHDLPETVQVVDPDASTEGITLRYQPRGVSTERVIVLRHDSQALSVYFPSIGSATVLDGEYTLDSLVKELLSCVSLCLATA